MPDADVEKVSLDPDTVSFMDTLIVRERGQVGLQNGFSPTSIDEDRAGAISGGGTVIKTRAEDKEKTSTPPEQICPVGLHKAVLLYPPSVSLRHNTFTFLSHVVVSLSVLQFVVE